MGSAGLPAFLPCLHRAPPAARLRACHASQRCPPPSLPWAPGLPTITPPSLLLPPPPPPPPPGQDIKLKDRGLVWNTDLIEAVELENLLANAAITMHSAEQRK